MAGNIKGLFIELGADSGKLLAAFRAADSSIKSTQTQLRDLNRALKFDPKNMDLLKDKQKAMTKEIENTKQKLKTLQEAQKQMDAQGVDKNSESYRNLQTEIDITKSRLKGLEAEYKKFGSASAQHIAEVGKSVKGVGEKMSAAGSKMTMGFTAPVVAGAALAVNAYGDVDKQFNLVKQTMGDTANSAADFQGLWDQMGTSAKNSVYGMQDAADATLNYARQGFTAKEATEMLTPAMSLAAGTGTELSETTEGLGVALKIFNGSANDASMYSDVLAKAQAQANTTTSDLFEVVSKAGPMFSSFGWSIKDAAAMTDYFGEAGIKGDQAGVALSTGLARLASPAKSGSKYMQELGLSTGQTYAIFNDNGSIKSMPEVLENLNHAFEGLNDQERTAAMAAIFGKEQMKNWNQVVQTSPEKIHALRDALDNCSGSANDMANALMSGTGGSIEQLKSTFDVLKVTIGQQLAPAFAPLIKFVTNLMDGFTKLSPEIQQMIMRIVAVVAAIGPLLLIGGKLLTGIGQFMIFAPIVASAIGAVSLPMIGVIAAIAAVVAIGVALYKNWDKIKDGAKKLGENIGKKWGEIKKSTVEAWGHVKDTVKKNWDGLKNHVANSPIGKIVGNVWTAAKKTMTDRLIAMKKAYDDHGGGMKGAVAATMEGIKGHFTAGYSFINNLTGGKLGEMVGKAKSRFGEMAASAGEKMGNIKNSIAEKLGGGIQTGLSKLGEFANGAGDKIGRARDLVRTGIDAIKGFFGGLQLKFPEIKLPHFKAHGGLDLSKFPPELPYIGVEWYDKGGIFSAPTVIGVGEKRPEFVGALDDLRTIVREESGGGNPVLLRQLVGLMIQLVAQTAEQNRLLAAVGGGGNTYNVAVEGITLNDTAQMDSRITDFVAEMLRKGRMY